MKTILNAANISQHIFSDETEITLQDSQIDVGPSDFLELIILDLNSTNAVVVENVTPPDDWASNKYDYTDSAWVLRPIITPPEEPVEV